MPVTSGVIRRFTNGRMRDTPISTNDPAITTPEDRGHHGLDRRALLDHQAAAGDQRADEVEAGALDDQQAGASGPKRLHWTKVAMPEITSDIDTIRVVSRLDTPSAWQISSRA
ncbi:hypothetical protein OH687_26055 [Burkholderia anthina]|nr:hypothetical protein OH687_26055 [Burkholderia anthina]